MSDYQRDQCASCSAPIIWAITTRAARMPVDAEPSTNGNISLEARPGLDPLARVLTVAQQFGRTNLRTSHFARCPQAARWRKRGRA